MAPRVSGKQTVAVVVREIPCLVEFHINQVSYFLCCCSYTNASVEVLNQILLRLELKIKCIFFKLIYIYPE